MKVEVSEKPQGAIMMLPFVFLQPPKHYGNAGYFPPTELHVSKQPPCIQESTCLLLIQQEIESTLLVFDLIACLILSFKIPFRKSPLFFHDHWCCKEKEGAGGGKRN